MKEPFQLLLPYLQGSEGSTLLIADENVPARAFHSVDQSIPVISNRYDVVRLAMEAGLEAHFSDFDFAPFIPRQPNRICYRVSKEKAAVHHVINQALKILPADGTLLLTGTKKEGIKTYAKQVERVLGAACHTEKHGDNYLVILRPAKALEDELLNDQNYRQLRSIGELRGKPIFSKPGLFGWQKFDEGSVFLADHLDIFLELFESSPSSVLDLGCGYGYLSLRASEMGVQTVTATDNCAAAIIACQENFRFREIPGTVLASDAGDILTDTFDAILCNPPFHRGFFNDGGLTDKFLTACRRLMRPGGRALLVVNQFVPLESKASAHFRHCEKIAENRSFKLVILR